MPVLKIPINQAWSSFKVLGVRVNAVQIPEVITQMEHWISEHQKRHFIAVTGMHGVTEAQCDETFKQILNAADLVVPDGKPLVWLGCLRGYHLKHRVYGPELMLAFCEQTAQKGYKHFFYGGAPGVPEQVAKVLKNRFPDLEVVKTYSPPFQPLTSQEDVKIVAMINQVCPDLLWIGLSTPKQERWMYEHYSKLQVPVMVGVGAAFDLITGQVKQAPLWMREHGLEWLWRLIQEPRRLWKRYLIYGSKFIYYILVEQLGLKKFN